MKRVIFEFKNADGSPAAGLNVKAADCGDLDSSKDGLAVFLIDSDNIPLLVNGKEVAKFTLADIADKVTMTENGGSWTAS